MQEFLNKAMLSLGLTDVETKEATGYLMMMVQHGMEEPVYKALVAGLRNGHRMVIDLPQPAPDSAETAFQVARERLSAAGLVERQIHSFIYMLLDHLAARKGPQALDELLTALPALAPYRTP